MTREQWDSEWLGCFNRLRAKGYDDPHARTMAIAITRARNGPRPQKPALWLRIALRVAGRKVMGLQTQEAGMGPRILNAVVYGAVAVIGALQISGIPQDSQGWLGLVGVFFTAAWGKFSSSSTIISPNRAVWTPSQRKANADADAATSGKQQ